MQLVELDLLRRSDAVPMTSLALYESARRALAEAHRVDEVKGIRDKAEAMRVYARQAKDTELIDRATEIKLRAERRGGELLREMAERGERDTGHGHRKSGSQDATSKLADLGVTKTQSSRWQKLAALDDAAFEAHLAAARKEALASLEMTTAERQAEKRERRAEREVALAQRQIALPAKRFGVLYSDPPWHFEPYMRETSNALVDHHYSTMNLDEIKAIDLPSIAADDSVLFLWATVPMLPHALEVMAACGFTYKSHIIWMKDRIGTGYWFRNLHELLLVGTRGNIPAPAPGTQWPSVIEAPVGRHSEKPEAFYRLIEAYYPNLPKIELFARARREGWVPWGLEAPDEAAE